MPRRRKRDGRLGKQQGREAAGGFRATIKGFPLQRKSCRPVVREGEKSENEREREGEASVGETEKKRRGTRKVKGAGTVARKRDRIERGGGAGERAKREGPWTRGPCRRSFCTSTPRRSAGSQSFPSVPLPPDNTTRNGRSPTRSFPRPPYEEEIPPIPAPSGSSVLRSFRLAARCELQPATTGRCRTKLGRKCLGERCRESLFPFFFLFFFPFGSSIPPGPGCFVRNCVPKARQRDLPDP